MLRGPQTPGELRQRVDRLYSFADQAAFEATLARLMERGFVARHARRPGQKEDRFAHRLSEDLEDEPAAAPPPAPVPVSTPAPAPAPTSTATAWTGSSASSPRSRPRSPSFAPSWE